ncbi:ABC transporter permease [Maioricimonas sp. JC845]|uniref:ABC transporter permease n=1 Tax=Maioricimonas sp. JC845 TaxID=3232138 RepID=UPI0034592032
MTALDRKLLRNLWQMKGQAIAICAVIACGVATFVMSLSTMESLRISMERYYQQYRFSHVFAGLKRAPLSLLDRIALIPGVSRVYGRIVQEVTLDVPGFDEPVVGRLTSIPDYGEPPLNSLHLRSGRWIEPGRTGEVIVNEAFAEAHRLQPGDTIDAVLNGRKKELTIVGTAITPEYIYQIRAGELLPDDKRFGLFWMNEREISAVFDMEGAFNDVVASVTYAASMPEILRQLDELIEPYGGLGSYDRTDQSSHQFIDNEIKQLRNTGMVIPIIFLGVAAFLLNVVLTRLINTQREEIAALKAFGYSGLEIGVHYLKMVAVIVVSGTLVGTAFGVWLGQNLTVLYTEFFRFPTLEFRFDWSVVISALTISLAAGGLGTVAAVRGAVVLPPAEAMRPAPPASYRPTILEQIGLQELFSQSARIVMRNLERQPVKSLLSCLGIAMGLAILIVGSYSKDSIDYVMEAQFFDAQRQDVSVTFVEPLTPRALHELTHLPGVLAVEPFRAVPARMRSKHHSRRVGIMGLPAEGLLYRPLDVNRRVVSLPPEGLLMSRKLADILDVRPGETIQVEVLEGDRPHHELLVAELLDDFAGLSAYMSIDAVHELMQEDRVLSGAHLTVDPRHTQELYTELKNTPHVASVTVKLAALRSFEETIAENLLRMQFFNVLFSSVIAFGVVYNSARISLSERSRELATLRVIGFTRQEISAILLGELAVLVLLAIPLGLCLGYGFAYLTTLSMVDTEMFRIPLVIQPKTYAFATTVIILAALFSGLAVRRRLDRLDLIGVLKTRE